MSITNCSHHALLSYHFLKSADLFSLVIPLLDISIKMPLLQLHNQSCKTLKADLRGGKLMRHLLQLDIVHQQPFGDSLLNCLNLTHKISLPELLLNLT